MKTYKIKDRFFNQPILLAIGTPDEMNEHLKKRYDVEVEKLHESDGAHFIVAKQGETNYWLWLRSFNWRIHEQGIAVHEINHLTFKVLDDIGFKYNEGSEEMYCYYSQAIFCEVWHKLKTAEVRKQSTSRKKHKVDKKQRGRYNNGKHSKR